MNDEQLKEILASMGDMKAGVPKHRTALRSALLREHARRRSYFSLETFTHYITMKTALIPVSTFAILALVVVGTLGVTQKSAEAQELVERSIARAVKLTPEFRAQIEAQLKADMMETLQEAYAAPDLRILTKEEYEKEAQFTISTTSPGAMKFMHKVGTGVAGIGEGNVVGYAATHAAPIEIEHDVEFREGEEGAVVAGFVQASAQIKDDVVFEKAVSSSFTSGTMVGSMHMNPPVKYLRYTDPDGRKVTLGLDESDTPVFRIEELVAGDIIPGPNGEIGIKGKVLKVINVDHIETN